MIEKEAIHSWRRSHPLLSMMDLKTSMLGKQRLNHSLPRAACWGRIGVHMPQILLTPWHPSWLLLETRYASSWTHNGCTYLLLQACAQAPCWAGWGKRSPNPNLELCLMGPRTILHQPVLGRRMEDACPGDEHQQGLCKHREMQRWTRKKNGPLRHKEGRKERHHSTNLPTDVQPLHHRGVHRECQRSKPLTLEQ